MRLRTSRKLDFANKIGKLMEIWEVRNRGLKKQFEYLLFEKMRSLLPAACCCPSPPPLLLPPAAAAAGLPAGLLLACCWLLVCCWLAAGLLACCCCWLAAAASGLLLLLLLACCCCWPAAAAGLLACWPAAAAGILACWHAAAFAGLLLACWPGAAGLCFCLPLPAFAYTSLPLLAFPCLCLPLPPGKQIRAWKTHGNLGCQESRTKNILEYLLLKKYACPTFKKLDFCSTKCENSWKTQVIGAEDKINRILYRLYLKKSASPTFKKLDFHKTKQIMEICGVRSWRQKNKLNIFSLKKCACPP